ncbi:MAG TPA: hypothetical protein DDX85_04495 [Nitrospiraceae bacterium]|nr:hypothetical protein [Nitrospiraceae bacterium]
MAINILNSKHSLHRTALERPLDEIAIFLATPCNLTCKMCSVWKKGAKGVEHGRVFSLLDEARKLGATRFIPCGAEIFTREDTFDILSYAEGIGFEKISAVSNGTLLMNGQRIDRLAKLRTLSIAISVDGPEEVHDELRGKGVYDKAVATLRELRKRNINACIASVIMRNTIDSLPEIVDLAARLDVKVISLQPYQRETAGPDKKHDEFEFKPEDEKSISTKMKQLMGYAEEKNIYIYTGNLMEYVPPYLSRGIRPVPQKGCVLPSRQINVYSDGECRSCFFLGRSLGNIYELSLNEIWHNTIHRELIHLALNRKCPGCLAACSDISSFKSGINKDRVFKLIKRVVKGVKSRI